ncbi:MAG: hypothetical protein V7K37_14155 [Nostoc sp.]
MEPVYCLAPKDRKPKRGANLVNCFLSDRLSYPSVCEIKSQDSVYPTIEELKLGV